MPTDFQVVIILALFFATELIVLGLYVKKEKYLEDHYEYIRGNGERSISPSQKKVIHNLLLSLGAFLVFAAYYLHAVSAPHGWLLLLFAADIYFTSLLLVTYELDGLSIRRKKTT